MTQEIDIDESDDGYGSGGYGVRIELDEDEECDDRPDLKAIGTDYDNIGTIWFHNEGVGAITTCVDPREKMYELAASIKKENGGGRLRASETNAVIEAVVESYDTVDYVEAQLFIDGEVEYEWVIR